MKFELYLNEKQYDEKAVAKYHRNMKLLRDTMKAWRDWQWKNRMKYHYMESDVVGRDLGMGTIRFEFPEYNIDPKLFAKMFLKKVPKNELLMTGRAITIAGMQG